MVKRIVAAALVLLASAGVASAANNLWFTLESSSGAGSLGTVTSGPGQALVINKTGALTLTIGINVTTASGTMTAWSVNLPPVAGWTGSNNTFLGLGYAGNFDDGGQLIDGVGQFIAAGTGSTGLVFTFDMDKNDPNALGTTDIFGDYEQFRPQVDANGSYWVGNVGPNTQSVGIFGYGPSANDTNAGGWGNLAVITINNVPEPATIALLGLGLVAVLRRRR